MKKWIIAYKETLIFTSLVILIPMFTSALIWHQFEGFPLGMLVTHWLVLLFILHDRQNTEQTPSVIRFVFWIMPVVSLIVGAIQALARTNFDGGTLATTVLFFAYGLLFLALGNLLPKVRQNSTIGIRIKWTLENEENWNATHRFSGKVWVCCGLLGMICALFVESAIAWVLFSLDVIALALLPMLYSYRYYRRQLNDGKVALSPVSRKGVVIVACIMVLLAAFVGWSLLSGSLTTTLEDEAIHVEAGGWKDLTIAYDDIDDITYFAYDPSKNVEDARVGGFGNLRFAMGNFENSLYGRYIRYTYVDCDACVTLKVDDKTIVLNEVDEAATKNLYERLLEKVE